MKSQEELCIQRLVKPDQSLNTTLTVDKIGLEYSGFQINTIKALNEIFKLDSMHAAEFEHGDVARSFYRLSKELKKGTNIFGVRPLISGKFIGCNIFYICRASQFRAAAALVDCLGAGEPPYIVRESLFAKSYEDHLNGREPEISGWWDINKDIFLFIDKEMYTKVKETFFGIY